MTHTLKPGDALLLVDVQNDFMPGGALPVAEGDAVVDVLNGWISAAREAGVPVFASRDWHPEGHVSFEERGGPWPPHCVQDTGGAAFHADLDIAGVHVVSKAATADKDAYSAFEGTDLAERLAEARVHRVWIGGLALDYCVRATALDAVHAGFETHVLLGATRAISEESARDARRTMEEAGVVLEEGNEHAFGGSA